MMGEKKSTGKAGMRKKVLVPKCNFNSPHGKGRRWDMKLFCEGL